MTRTTLTFATLTIATFLVATSGRIAHAAAVWDGGGGGDTSVFNDLNWNPDTTVDPGSPVGMDLTINNGDVATIGHTQVLALGIGNTFTLNDVSLGFSGVSAVPLPTGAAADAAGNQTIILNGAATMRYFWGWDNDWMINGTSVLTMGNNNTSADGGGLGKDSTVNFGGFGGTMNLLEINLTELTAAWQAKFFVNGVGAVWGSDASVIEAGDTIVAVSDGNNGVIVTPVGVAIPAPAALPTGLALMGVMLVARSRRA